MVTAALAAVVTALGIGAWKAGENVAAQRFASKDHDTFYKALQSRGYDNIDLNAVLNYAVQNDLINEEDYKNGLNIISDMEKFTNGELEWGDLPKYFSGKKKSEEAGRLYRTLTQIIPDYDNYVRNAASLTSEEFRDQLLSSLPDVSDVPKPTYFDINAITDNNIEPVRPMYLPTGQELADVNNINYDPNYYYDLIKQGTEAAVDYADFQNRVTNNASMLQDTAANNSYLDTIRNAKQEAIANGATAGARAASELLATSNAMGNYSAGQAQAADAQMQNISEPLLQDAQAKITARDYFNKLAQDLMTSSLTFYNSDAERYGAEWDRNANLLKANNTLRAGYDTANAMMNNAYTQNQAVVNAARANLNAQANQYAWLFDIGVKANGNTPEGIAKTLYDIERAITRNATNGQFDNRVDYFVAQNNK